MAWAYVDDEPDGMPDDEPDDEPTVIGR